MSRAVPSLLLSCVALLGAGLARAQDDDPPLRGIRLSEWLERLKGDRQANLRPVFILAVGGAGHRAIDDVLYRSRRGGLLAVELIGPFKSRKVFPALLAALQEDPDPRIREGAAQALGRLSIKARKNAAFKLGLTGVREGLIAALRRDKVGGVRQAAAAALGQVYQDPETKETHLVHELSPALLDIKAALRDPDAATSSEAAETIRRMGKDAGTILADLIAILQDKNANELTRVRVAQALGKIGVADALPALKTVLADRQAPLEVRRYAAESIGKLGKDGADAIGLLGTVLVATDAPVELRRAVAAALDQFGSDARSALPSLKKAIKDNDKFVRCLVMHTMGQMKRDLGDNTRDVVTVLLQALDDPVLEVRVAALETFGNLGQEALGDDAKAVVDRVTAMTKDSLKDVREGAENALKKLKM